MILLPGTAAVLRPAALGVAARIAWQHGRPTLSEETLGWLEERVRREEGQIQLILVVDTAEPALWMPLPFDAVLAGIVAEQPLAAPPADVVPVPIVSGVDEARACIGEGTLLLVDPHRWCVCVEPSAEEVLAVERRKRRRVLLGPAHTPATTRTGVTMPVWAAISEGDAIADAVRNGADGLFFIGFHDIGIIAEGARAMGGGPVAAAVSADKGFQLARDADVFLWGTIEPSAWTAALESSPPGTEPPRRLVTLSPDTPPGDVDSSVDGVVVFAEQLPLPVVDLPPLWTRVADPEQVAGAIAGGAAVLLSPPDRIEAVKDAVRTSD